MVQGQIAINFISEGYLYAVLDNVQSSSTSSNPQQDELNQLVAAQSNPGQTVLGVATPTDPTVQARIQALTASLGPSGLDTAKAYSKKVQLGSLATTAQFPNAVYQGGPIRYRGGLYCRRTHCRPASGELLTRYPAPAEAKKPHARAQAPVLV